MMRPLADAAAPQDGAIAFKGLLPREAAAIAIVADAVTAAREALRLAQRAAPGQQVVIFDLLGDNSPLAELVPDDDPHGISDAVRYGLSLRALARPVRSLRRVYVVRGGQESPFDAEVLGSRIWEVWREQIRRGAGLMLVALRSDAGGTASLLERLDGVVLPRGVPRPSERVHVVGHVGQVELEPRRSQARPAHVPKKRVSTWRWPVAVFVLVAVGGTLIAVWRAGMWPFGSRLPGGTSVQPGALGTTAASQPTEPSLPASWSVELANANSLPAAIRRSLELADSLPAVTVGIGAESSSGAWYRILAGAFLTSSAADSLAWSLQERGLAPAGIRVVQAPFAWLLEERVPADSVALRLSRWRSMGIPAYAIRRGTRAAIYFGAFESFEEGSSLSSLLDSLNVSAILTPRVGSKP